ncbi:hypothetical protein Q7A53_02035 [Halobacillus rhizosphaerae]|uniref:hypothetical protein n=1 Tax=Halobacillus rhizosphaerae TaxID=3064889 RepID=UPI00398B7FD6
MSLTTMLNGKKKADLEFQTILRNTIPSKKEFSTYSGKKAFTAEYQLSVPYILTTSYQASVVGTAFDLMARFIISQTIKNNKDTVLSLRPAREGLELIKRFCNENTSESLNKKYIEGTTLAENFIKNRDVTYHDLLPYATFMARLEHTYRSGMPSKNIKADLIGEEESEILVDLEQLCEVFKQNFMTPQVINHESVVVFNPHFGFASRSCGGADADVYIDGTLYDFKTTKITGYRWKEIAQVFGYYFLDCVENRFENNSSQLQSCQINRLAFYKARYGEVEYIDISTMNKEKLCETTNKLHALLSPRISLMREQETLISQKRSDLNVPANRDSYFGPVIFLLVIMLVLMIFIFI